MGFKRSYYILIFLVISIGHHLHSQSGVNYGGPSVAITDHPLLFSSSQAMIFNPAAVVDVEERWSAALGAQRVYNTDISNLFASATKQIGNQGIGVSVSNYGIDGFRRSHLSGSYGMRLSDGFALGVTTSLYQLQVEGLGNTSSINTSLGVIHRISPSLSYAASLHNLLGDHNAVGTNRHTRLALRYDISPLVAVYTTANWASGATVSFRPGLRYRAFEMVHLLFSIDTASQAYNYGTELILSRQWSLSAGLSSHPRLGTSLSILAGYHITQDY